MSIRHTRAGVTQAKFNDEAMGIVALEVLALSVAIGIGKNSWWWGGGVFIGSAVILAIPVLNVLFSVTLSAMWAIVGYAIGTAINQNGANYILAIIAGLSSLGWHLGAIQWSSDIGERD